MKMKVFISYAETNSADAERLYNDLEEAGVIPWMDKNTLAGVARDRVVPREIEESSYFIVLLSTEYANTPGYIHKELKIAFDILDKSPGSRTFIIPVRLDDCIPADIDERLKYIKYVDLSTSYKKGLEEILRVLKCNKIDKKLTQISGEITLIWGRDRQIKYPYKVQKLKQEIRGKKLIMTWDTFINGLMNLKETINNAPAIQPEIIFGINESGIIAATYLSTQLREKARIGIIKTGGKLPPNYKREIKQFDFPNHKVIQFEGSVQVFRNVRKPKTVAIVDIELKSGGSVKSIKKKLKKKYGKKLVIYYFVLVGVIHEKDFGKEINDIRFFGWEMDEIEAKPDFLAYYIESPGARGPENMR